MAHLSQQGLSVNLLTGLDSCNNSSFGVDFEPFTPNKAVVLTFGIGTLVFAALADRSAPVFEGRCAIIGCRNRKFPEAISEAVLPVSHDANEPIVERISAVVHGRDASDYDFSRPVDVHPAFLRR